MPMDLLPSAGSVPFDPRRPVVSGAAVEPERPQYAHPPLLEVRLRVTWHGTLDPASITCPFLEDLGLGWRETLDRPAGDETVPGDLYGFSIADRPLVGSLTGQDPTQSADDSLLTVSDPTAGDDPASIVSLESVLGDQRIEFGPGHFDFVWDGRLGNAYPHYELVRDAFVQVWDAFLENAGRLRLKTVRVTYLNRIPQGTVWQEADDLSFCRFLPAADGLRRALPMEAVLASQRHHWRFGLPQQAAVLDYDLQVAAVDPHEEQVIWLGLSVTSKLPDDPQILRHLDDGRDAIVTMFRRSMSAAANQYWGLAD